MNDLAPEQRRHGIRRLIIQLKRRGKPDAANPVYRQIRSEWQDGQIRDFEALKLLAAEAAAKRDKEAWLNLLVAFDPAMAKLSRDAVPVLFGIGRNTLNSGRLVEVDGERRFEKIYVRGSSCFRQMRHAYADVLEPLAPVTFAPIRALHWGERLVAVQFGFVDGAGSFQRQPKVALRIARQLGEVALSQAKEPTAGKRLIQTYPGGMKRARATLLTHLGKSNRRVSARLALQGSWRERMATAVDMVISADNALVSALPDLLDRWSARVEGMGRVFSHGDLNRPNIARHGALIDWDCAGWRAYGYDAAYATAFHAKNVDMGALRALSKSEVERPGSEIPDRFAYFYFLLHHMTVENALRLRLRVAKALVAELEALEARF